MAKTETHLTPIGRLIQDRLGRDDLAIPEIMIMILVFSLMSTLTVVWIKNQKNTFEQGHRLGDQGEDGDFDGDSDEVGDDRL